MLGDYVGERLSKEIVIRYLSCKLVKIACFGRKAPLWCFLTEKWQLGSIRRPKVYNLFRGTLGVLQAHDCKRGAFGKDQEFEFCGETVVESVTEKTKSGGGVKSNQVVRWLSGSAVLIELMAVGMGRSWLTVKIGLSRCRNFLPI